MQVLLQRVASARVEVAGEIISEIGAGLLVLVGVERRDDEETVDRMAEKIRQIRIFSDAEGRMNASLGRREVLCVSQFTLCADTRKGNRPSFSRAAEPEAAETLYERLRESLGAKGGRFGEEMQVHLVNDGPVTIPLHLSPEP